MKNFLAVLLTVAFFLTAAMPTFAAGEYEFSDKITDVDQIGSSFYPGITTADDAYDFPETDLGKELVAAAIAKYGTAELWVCLVGEGMHEFPGGSIDEVYFEIYYDPDWEEVYGGLVLKENVPYSIKDTSYYVCRPVTVPSTGDNTPIALTAGLLLLSGIALVILKKRTVR